MKEGVRVFPGVDRKARMALPYIGLPVRLASERVKDFAAVKVPLDAERAKFEASRCIHCPDPAPCTKACPAHNDISLALWHIENGEFLEAAKVYRQTSSMPSICSQICPHNELCEGGCVRSKNGEPVHTGALETFVSDYERRTVGVVIPVGNPTGKKVAVVGAGPSGMACADLLIQYGHLVTVFEARTAPGGLLIYGIPNFKLPKEFVFSRWADLRRAGVRFIPNVFIGKDKTVDELFEDGYHAVFIAVGVGRDVILGIPGEDLPGVWRATDYLIRANVDLELMLASMGGRPEVGEDVVVIGGGDTAYDCLRTSIRMGASQVTCLYRRSEAEMPGNAHDRKLAVEEGAKFEFLVQPLKFIPGENGHLAQIECIRMCLGEPDASGRARPIPIEGSNFIISAHTAIKSLGYSPDETLGKRTPGLTTHQWGLIIVNPETGVTSRPGVYAAGDITTGPGLVVTAMVTGRKAAEAINNFLADK